MEERFKTFTVMIAGINRCIRRIKTEEMAPFCLKSPHVSCLYYLYSSGPLTAKELCDICGEDKSNISRSIRYLEECGYIECQSRTAKRYQSPLLLTDDGRVIAASVAGKIDAMLALASEGLTEEERVILYRSLGLIHENLRRICGDYSSAEQ